MKKIAVILLNLFFFFTHINAQQITDDGFEALKIKGLSFWQVKKKLDIGPYKISKLKRSMNTASEMTIGGFQGDFTKSKSDFWLSFDLSKDTLEASFYLSNLSEQKEIKPIQIQINIPLEGKEVLTGTVKLGQETVPYFLAKEFKSFKINIEGGISMEDRILKLEEKINLKKDMMYVITEDQIVYAKADAQGNIYVLPSVPEKEKLIYIGILSSVIFNNQN
jgi:hypothetical protein